MNESGGGSVMDGMLRNNGALSGSPAPAWQDSPLGKALSFNGSSAYVNVGTDSMLKLPPEMSITAFMNTNNVGSGQQKVIVGNVNAAGNLFPWAIVLNRHASGDIVLIHSDGASTGDFGKNVGLSAGRWYRIGIVRTGTTDNWTVTFYLDGITAGAATGTGNPSNTNQTTAIGRFGACSALYWDGSIGDVMLWNRALSASEMQWLYAEPYAFMQPAAKRIWLPRAGVASYTLAANPGTLTLAGAAVTPVAARRIAASTGTVVLSGGAATLQRGAPSGALLDVGISENLVTRVNITETLQS